MATKKLSAQTTVAEKPAKTVKTLNAAATLVAAKAVKTEKTTAPSASKKPVIVAEPMAKAASVKVTAAADKAAPVNASAPAVKTSKVTFVLPKEAVENAETVAVFGDFNNWQNGTVLAKQKDGSFKTAVELEKGRSYEYRFLINGEKWENDWAAEAYLLTPFGNYNSVVTA
ncbi:MAG: isoamylase early set domain-containing protein [Saprospiraceae bacterium]|nr:isoamylase early set domain-containing protein [Saprospiraceae bacterium]